MGVTIRVSFVIYGTLKNDKYNENSIFNILQENVFEVFGILLKFQFGLILTKVFLILTKGKAYLIKVNHGTKI